MRSLFSHDPPAPTASPPLLDSSEDTRQPKRRPHSFWLLPVLLLGFVGLITLALVLAPADISPIISGLSQLLSMLFCLSCTLWLVAHTPRGRTRWAWLCIALAQLSYVVGDAAIIALSAQDAPATSVSLADAFFLPLSPLTALGTIFFPPIQSTIARQLRVLLDVCIVVGALFGLALIFLIAPRFASGTPADYVFIIYPVAEFTLLTALTVLLVRGVQAAYRPVLFWLIIGMLCLVYADTMYNYLTLPGLHTGPSYTAGTPFIDPFWVAGAFAFSLAPLSLLWKQREPGTQWTWLENLISHAPRLHPTGLPGQFLLLAAPVIVLFGLLALSGQREHQASTALEILTLLVVLLIIIRQLLTMRDLVDARIATERAERLDALKDQFITSVNHELRTPLMTMQGYLQLLADPQIHVAPDKWGTMLERANRACTTLVHLVQSILDTRRIDQEASDFTPEVVHLQTAMQAALTLIDPREATPTEGQISLQIPGDLVIWGESVRVQQILTNLLSNAIKYSPPGMPVTVKAQIVAEPGARFHGTRGSQRRQMVEITVQDRGLGIPPEQKDLLFRRFVRLPRDLASNVRGTGLGLYLCRVFAEAMGGTIWVESTGVPGEGSTFHLRLPVPHEQSIPLATPPAQAGAH